MKTHTFLIGTLVSVSLCMGACGDDSDDEGGTTSSGETDSGEGGGGGETGDGDDLGPCSERSMEECSSDNERCYAVKARQVVEADEGYCTSEVLHTECRELEGDCSEDDAEGFWCDEDGGMWWTPQLCGPEGFESCTRPAGELPACL